MEFSYRITETDYLYACKIKVAPRVSQRLRWSKHAYRLLLFTFVFGTFASGLLFGWKDATAIQIEMASPPLGRVFSEAIIPALVISLLYFSVLGVLHRYLTRNTNAQLEHYRSDPSCQCETTLTVTPEQVFFRCANGCLTQSGWNIYKQWVESGNIILLITLAGVRKIVNIAGLSEVERDELRGILSAALPLKK
jgi:hypothetical protein